MQFTCIFLFDIPSILQGGLPSTNQFRDARCRSGKWQIWDLSILSFTINVYKALKDGYEDKVAGWQQIRNIRTTREAWVNREGLMTNESQQCLEGSIKFEQSRESVIA